MSGLYGVGYYGLGPYGAGIDVSWSVSASARFDAGFRAVAWFSAVFAPASQRADGTAAVPVWLRYTVAGSQRADGASRAVVDLLASARGVWGGQRGSARFLVDLNVSWSGAFRFEGRAETSYAWTNILTPGRLPPQDPWTPEAGPSSGWTDAVSTSGSWTLDGPAGALWTQKQYPTPSWSE